jgi:hypothetical protein
LTIKQDPETGRFIKGNSYGVKGVRRSPKTEFKKDKKPHNFKGTGIPTVYIRKNRTKEVYVTLSDEKVSAKSRGKEYETLKRTSYARYLWKEHHGEIPEGMIVYNNRAGEVPNIEDLELITRAELIKRNRRG